jgi:hypothetical protein
VSKPTFAADAVSKYLDLRPQIEEHDDVQVETNFDTRNNDPYKIWYWIPANVRKDRFVLFIPGGAFVAACPTLSPFRHMKNLNQAVVTFNYPNIIVMKNTRNKDIVNFCQQTVLHIVDRMRTLLNNTNLKCTIMGHSAGVYFATRVLTSNQSEVFTSIDRFVGICGYYGARTVNNNVLKLLDKLYLNDKPLDLASFITVRTKQQLRNSDVIPQIPFVIDQLYITTTDDFLRDSTMTYTSQLDCSGVLTYRGEHNLFHRPENAQAKEMYARIVEFVN